jgi:Gpi18-like mannosyltransferase
VLAVYFYIKVVKHLYGAANNLEALRAVAFFILFPAGVVLLATYTESLFAFLALGSIYFTLKKRLVPTAILTLFATATHFNGLFIIMLVGLMLLEQREKIAKIILTLAVGSLGILSYMIFLYAKYKNPFEFILAQKTNGWLHSNYLHHLLSTFNILDIGGIALIVSSVYFWWSRKKSFAIYSLLYLLIPIIGGQFNGLYRYSLMAFPFQLMLYERFRKNKFAYATLIALFGIFWGYFLLQYMGGYTGAGG